MLNAFHDGIDGALKERDIAVELGNQFRCLVCRQVKRSSKLALTHAVHQTECNGLGLLTRDTGKVCHHLVEVGAGVVVVHRSHL